MAKKTTKKTKTTAKKTVVKKSTTKKIKRVSKKTPTKVERIIVRDIEPCTEQKHECGCGCGHCCCHGSRVFNVLIKLIVLCMVFLLGCISAPWFIHNPHKSMMRNIQFDDNGCVVLENVKCPKMLEMLSGADNDSDGCVSRAELKNAISEMRKAHENHEMPVPDDIETPTESVEQ